MVLAVLQNLNSSKWCMRDGQGNRPLLACTVSTARPPYFDAAHPTQLLNLALLCHTRQTPRPQHLPRQR